jgi:hypothetical protein
MKYRAGSSTESKDEDDEDPPVVIDKSKKSSFTQQTVGLGGNLSKGCKAPLVTHRRGRTDHDNRRSSRLEFESAEAEGPVHTEALNTGLRIRCDFGDGILSFFHFMGE